MPKGLIILESENFVTTEEWEELKHTLKPLGGKYKIALMEGKCALNSFSPQDIEQLRQRALNVLNRYFDPMR